MKTSPSVIASIVLPLTILTVFWMTVTQPPSENPDSLPMEIQEIDALFADTQPEVIVVGSSLAHRAIESTLFAKQLGLEEDKVQKLWSGMAAISAVSLMIENRIFAKNLQPKVVAILCPPLWLSQIDILQDANFALHQTRPLTPLMSEVLRDMVPSSPSPWKQRKSDFQNEYQELNKDIFGEYLLGQSQESIDSDLDALFASENQRKNVKESQLLQHNIRETEEKRESRNDVATLDLRLLESIAKQLNERSIQLVVTVVPVSKGVKDYYAQSDEDMRTIIEMLRRYEASFIDLSEWDEPNVFGDTKHLNGRGRKMFTKLLAEEWNKLGILGDQPSLAQTPLRLLKPTITNLTNARIEAQDSIALTFPTGHSQISLNVCMSSTDPIKDTVFVESVNRSGSNQLWCEQLLIKDIQGNKPMTLTNRTDTSIQIHSIELDGLELLETPTILEAKMAQSTVEAKPSSRYPIVQTENWPQWLEKKKPDHPQLQIGDLSRYKGLTDASLADHFIPFDCRPLEILYNMLPLPLGLCKEVWGGESKYCVYNHNLISTVPEPIDWSAMQIRLKDDRLCHPPTRKRPMGFWVLPGDSTTTTFTWPKGDYSRLFIEGNSIGKGEWRIELFEDETVFLDVTITDPLTHELERLLDAPLYEDNRKAKIRITVPANSNAHLFVRSIDIGN